MSLQEALYKWARISFGRSSRDNKQSELHGGVFNDNEN